MVEIVEAAAARRFVLRGDAAVAAKAGEVLGVGLPLAPHGVAEAGGRAALWLGPDEWLLLAVDGDLVDFAVGMAGLPHSLVEVSDGYVALVLRGPGAARVLSAGCPLDLHLSAFPPGMATRTVLGRIGVTLWRRGAEEWRVELGRSLLGYARAFLTEASRGQPNG